MRRARWALVGAWLLIAVCSDGEEPRVTVGEEPSTTTTAPTTTTTTEPEPSAAVRAYFEVFATNKPAEMETMLERSEPGSPAHTYAKFQHGFAVALRDQGQTESPQTMTVHVETIEMCDAFGEEPECNTFGGFVVASDGRLRDFNTNGNPIASRLVDGRDRSTSAGGIRLTLIAAYRSLTSDALLVAMTASGGAEPVDLHIFSAEYLAPDGRQVSVVEAAGPTSLRPNANATVVLGFPAADVGGTAFLPGSTEDSDRFEAEIEIAT
jgi:hypothetical protein